MDYIDYHVHSFYSCDCTMPVALSAAVAAERGMAEIAYTDHYDFNLPRSMPCFDEPADMQRRRDELRAVEAGFGGKLKIRIGAELGDGWYEPQQAARFVRSNYFDFVLATTHGLRGGRDLYCYAPEGADPHALLDEYFETYTHVAEFTDFDCIGHLSYAVRNLTQAYGVNFDLHKYYDIFRDLFRWLVENGKGLELNTSARRQGFDFTYPDYEILSLYRELGGEIITVGSDSHYPEHVALGIKDETAMLAQLGFKYITSFENRKPKMIKIE